MYHAVQPQLDCIATWREAVRIVDQLPGHEGHNVLMTVQQPDAGASLGDPRVSSVNHFLSEHAKPLQTVANTIFPIGLYRRYGAPAFFDKFHQNVLPTVRRGCRWSGYYFERMTDWPGAPGGNPLWDIVQRIRDPQVRARNKFELALFDPARDVDRSPYGGQCLSFLSFKVLSGTPKTITLTALYRNHYYIEKLLGNLIGLGGLMAFVCEETGFAIGPLTVLSSHAKIDLPRSGERATTRADLQNLLDEVDNVACESA